MKVDLSTLMTEQTNNRSKNMDQLSTFEIIELMNDEDQTVATSVKKALPQISLAIEMIYTSLKNDGRLFYIGAGTSGRIGILDASECPPTFCTPPELIQGIIAGGNGAVFKAVEGAEDSREQGEHDLKEKQLQEVDVVVGIAASGRTPYVIGALEYASKIGAKTIALSCNKNAEISSYAELGIEIIVGPEVLTGSTRLKSATAQKMVLNMFTTATMIKLGKVYGNLMVDLNPSNAKLIERARNIVKKITGITYTEAAEILNQTDQKVKPAIVMALTGVSFEEANYLLNSTHGFVHQAIEKAEGGQLICEK